MPATDIIHDAVKNALAKDGWDITDDPFVISAWFKSGRFRVTLSGRHPPAYPG